MSQVGSAESSRGVAGVTPELAAGSARGRWWVGPGLVAALTALALLVATGRWGIGTQPDSAAYVMAARNVLAGRGLMHYSAGETRPLTHWPPLYPLTLAGVAACGVDVMTAARWLSALLLGVNIFLAGALAHASGAGKKLLLAVTLAMASLTMVSVHSFAMSEPLFLTLFLGGVLLTWKYVRRPRWVWLAGLSACFGLAIVTRYAGAAFVPVALLAIAWGAPGWGRKVLHLAVGAALMAAPLGLWVMRNKRLGGGATDRTVELHPITWAQAREGFATVGSWLVPDRLPTRLQLGVLGLYGLGLVLVVVLTALRWREVKGARGGSASPGVLYACFGVAYVGFLVVSISLLDSATPLDERILNPVFALVVLGAGLWMQRLERGGAGLARLRQLTGLYLGVLGGVAVLASGLYLGLLWRDGRGYTSKAWRTAPSMEAVCQMAPEQVVYSNRPEAIYFLSGRETPQLPFTAATDAEDAAACGKMAAELTTKGGVIVIFKGMDRPWILSESYVKEHMALHEYVQDSKATVYWLAAEPTLLPAHK